MACCFKLKNGNFALLNKESYGFEIEVNTIIWELRIALFLLSLHVLWFFNCKLHVKLILKFLWRQGVSRGGAIGAIASLNPVNVTLFSTNCHISENSIRDIRPFYHTLFCHSTVVKQAAFLLQQRSLPLKSRVRHFFCRALQSYNSTGDWAREVFKPSTNSASLLVEI